MLESSQTINPSLLTNNFLLHSHKNVTMKKYLFLALGILILSCESTKDGSSEASLNEIHTAEDTTVTEEISPLTLEEVSLSVIKSLANLAFDDLTAFESDKKDIIFSPYLTFNREEAACLSISSLLESYEKNATLYWGLQDGTGDPLNMTVTDYFKRYVNRGDYLSNETEMFVNEIKVMGNSINSIPVVFPDAEFVSFYLPPNEGDAAEISWKTLVLVFERIDNVLKLKAVVNHEWTI
jgi:hypothetical protein